MAADRHVGIMMMLPQREFQWLKINNYVNKVTYIAWKWQFRWNKDVCSIFLNFTLQYTLSLPSHALEMFLCTNLEIFCS